MPRKDTNTSDGAEHAGCYHIVRWAPSGIYCTIALRRCYRSRSAASTARYSGLAGDRSRDGDHLEAHGEGNRLTVVRCQPGCPCTKWRTGCNAGQLPEPAPKNYLACEMCGTRRRRVIELTDPRDETPRLYCRPCSGKQLLTLAFKGRQPLARWRHADEPAMLLMAEIA